MTKTAANKVANRLFREGVTVAIGRERFNHTSGHYYYVSHGIALESMELWLRSQSLPLPL